MDITVRLKQFREKRKITQQQAGDAIKIDQRQWSRYETGKNDMPIRTLIKLCKTYKITAEELYDLLGLNEEENQ